MKNGVAHDSVDPGEREPDGLGDTNDGVAAAESETSDSPRDEESRCEACGQTTSLPRLTFGRLFFDAIRKVVELDSPWLRTIGHVVYRPERVATAYIRGDRRTYVNPAKFCFIAGALTLAAIELARGSLMMPQNLESPENQTRQEVAGSVETGEGGSSADGEAGGNATGMVASGPGEDSTRSQQELIQEAVEAHARVSHIFNFLAIPALAVSLRFMFPKRGFNVAEQSVLGLYIYGEMFLLQMLTLPIGGFSSLVAVGINTAAVVVWSLWAIVRFEQAPWITGLLRAFAATALMWLFASVLTGIFVLAYVAYHSQSVL